MDNRMGFKGFNHPMTEEQVLPTIKSILKSALENLESGPEKVDTVEVVNLLNMLLECTVPATGYFYMPYVPLENADVVGKS
jgi:hypothetical protein